MISFAGLHLDLVVLAWAIVPSAAVGAVVLSTRDALRTIAGQRDRVRREVGA